jgi:hypothetical protein
LKLAKGGSLKTANNKEIDVRKGISIEKQNI